MITLGPGPKKCVPSSAKEYEKTSYMNKVAKRSKSKDLEYKAKEAAALDKSAAEAGSDKDGVQAELVST